RVVVERTSRPRRGSGFASGPGGGRRVVRRPAAAGRWGPWAAGLALAVVMLGPVLGPGAHLTLDLVLIDPVPVPRGAWGLGPELPRRVPLWVVVAWLSPLIGGDVVGKALMAGSVTVAFVGMHRLVSGLLAERATGAVTG